MESMNIETAVYRLNLANGCLTLTEKRDDGRTLQAIIGDVHASVDGRGTKLCVTFGIRDAGTSDRVTLDVPVHSVDKARELPRLLKDLAAAKVPVPELASSEPAAEHVAPVEAEAPASAADAAIAEPKAAEPEEPAPEHGDEPETPTESVPAGAVPAVRASMTPKVQVAPPNAHPMARQPAAPAPAAPPAPVVRASSGGGADSAPTGDTAEAPAPAPKPPPPKPVFTGAPALDLAFPADHDDWIVFKPLPATLRLITDP